MGSVTDTYQIIAYPHGPRKVVATLHGQTSDSEARTAFAAMQAGVSVASEADGIVGLAQTHARLLGEYVEVYRNNAHIATVGPEGVVA